MRKTSKIGRWLLLLAAFFWGKPASAQPKTGRDSLFFAVRLAAESVPDFEKNMAGFAPPPQKTGATAFRFLMKDSAAAADFPRQLRQFFWQKNFLAASLDSLEFAPSPPVFSAHLYLGPPIFWAKIRAAPDADPRWLTAAGWRKNQFSDRPLDPAALLRAEERLLETAENAGYPFAAIWLDSLEIAPSGEVSAVLQLARNQYFTFGKTQLRGDLRLPARYLSNYLSLRPGAAYSREKILRARERLRELPFAEMTADPTVTFSADGRATPNLFLKKKKAGRFDFLIGLLPRPAAATGGQLLLTGNLNANFQNALGWGENLAAEIERLRPETQKLDARAAVPYLFGQPFGAEGRLQIFRRDSTWVDALADAGAMYLLGGSDRVKFFWENKSTYLQKVDTAAVRKARRLPPNLDFRATSFGFDAQFSRLDYRFNPRRGWAFSVLSTAGFSEVRRNAQIEGIRDAADPSFSFSTLYDSLAARATRFRLEMKGEFYLPMFQRSALKLALRGAAMLSPDRPVFANEQYRLGGNKLLRGFDEESLFATRFAVATFEYRLLIGQNSWLAAFADGGYLENLTDRSRAFLRPLGLGAGMTFETRAGIFGISTAVGTRQIGQEAIDFRAAKFHIGYVSLF